MTMNYYKAYLIHITKQFKEHLKKHIRQFTGRQQGSAWVLVTGSLWVWSFMFSQ